MGQRTATNRITLARARWAAEACFAIAEARAARKALEDTATVDLGRSTTCRWSIEYADARLDVNHAPRAALVRLLTGLGMPLDLAQGFVAKLVATRRSRAFTDVRQIETLLPAIALIRPYLTVDGSGRVDARTASPVVMASLPGMTAESVDLLVRRRRLGPDIRSLDEFAGALSPEARAALMDGYAELAPMITFGSDRFTIATEGWAASYGRHPSTTIETVVERVPDRLAVLRRRVR